MEYSTAYLTPPYTGSERIYRGPVTPPTVRPRSSGDTSRWHPYTSRVRSVTPTSGMRSSRSSESVPSVSSSRQAWPQPAKAQYLYPSYESTYSERQPSPPRRPIGAGYYFTPDPSPHPIRYSHKHSFSVPPTIDCDLAASRSSHPALPPTPPRSRNASVEFDEVASIPFPIDSPHAHSAFVQQAYDLLISVYYHTSPPVSPISSPHGPNIAVCMPIAGSLPIDPPTLHWFTTELIRRASVSSGVLKLAISYITRARFAARSACEARVQTPISPPPSPLYAVPPQLDGGNIYAKRSKSRSSAMGPGPELADPRQMLLGALVLAQKFLIDAAYTSATWGRLSGLPTSDVAAVERALGSALEWRLWEKNL